MSFPGVALIVGAGSGRLSVFLSIDSITGLNNEQALVKLQQSSIQREDAPKLCLGM